jgi:hypothetical protein
MVQCYHTYNNVNYIGYNKEKAMECLHRAIQIHPSRPEAIRILFYLEHYAGHSFIAASIGYTHLKIYDDTNKGGYMFFEKLDWGYFADLSYVLFTNGMKGEFCVAMDYMEKCSDFNDEAREKMALNFNTLNTIRSTQVN